MPWWLVVLLFYLGFNLGFHIRDIHDQMRRDPLWPRWRRYQRLEIATEVTWWVIIGILPLPPWSLADVLWKRFAVELRIRRGARHA